MPEVKVNLFADYQRLASEWARSNALSGNLKIKGVGKQQDRVEPWLQEHSFEAAMENMFQRIVPRPRKVLVCNNFIVPVEHKGEVETILEVARTGGDLTQYLGNNICKLGAPDMMLNIWGISHFHMKPFAQRVRGEDDELLFAHITDDSFYVVGFGGHTDLKDTRFIKILQSNFPETLQRYRFNNAATIDIDSPNYVKLCESNINVLVSINGIAYYSPGGGVNVNRNSTKSYCEIVAMRRRLDGASKALEQGFLNGMDQLSKGFVGEIKFSTINLKFIGFHNNEILVECPELGLRISYRDGTGEMAVVSENANCGKGNAHNV